MIKPLLRTALVLFAGVTGYCWLQGEPVAKWITLVATLLVGAVEGWVEFLQPHFEKCRDLQSQLDARIEDDRLRSTLRETVAEAAALLERLEAAYMANMDGVTQTQAGSPHIAAEQDIERWIKETPAKLDELRVGWGARFENIGVPTRQQNVICGRQKHTSAGKLRLHRQRLVELLTDLDRQTHDS